jgi:hypothetical protein
MHELCMWLSAGFSDHWLYFSLSRISVDHYVLHGAKQPNNNRGYRNTDIGRLQVALSRAVDVACQLNNSFAKFAPFRTGSGRLSHIRLLRFRADVLEVQYTLLQWEAVLGNVTLYKCCTVTRYNAENVTLQAYRYSLQVKANALLWQSR